MKKVLVFVLAVVLVMSMVIPVSAANTNTNSTETKPFLFSSTSEDCVVYFANEIHKLTDVAQEVFENGLEAEDDVLVSKDMIPLDFLYISTSEKCTVVLRVENIRGLIVKQFINGMWFTMKSAINNDDTITVENVVEGPMLIYTIPNKVASPVAPKTSTTATAPLPVLVSATSDDYSLYATTDAYKLSLKARQMFVDAQESLWNVVPKNMAARYFFYMYTNDSCTSVFEIANIHEVVFMQYLEGEWAELESTINTDGTVTVEQVVEGPMAIFTK